MFIRYLIVTKINIKVTQFTTNCSIGSKVPLFYHFQRREVYVRMYILSLKRTNIEFQYNLQLSK